MKFARDLCWKYLWLIVAIALVSFIFLFGWKQVFLAILMDAIVLIFLVLMANPNDDEFWDHFKGPF
jgi:glucose-6-phosphate-specific signal transduction histidine kinase